MFFLSVRLEAIFDFTVGFAQRDRPANAGVFFELFPAMAPPFKFTRHVIFALNIQCGGFSSKFDPRGRSHSKVPLCLSEFRSFSLHSF